MPKFEQFRLPDVGEGLTEAEIVQWLVPIGSTVEVNDIIVEIETAKSLVELPSPYAGVVTEILVEEGTTVDVGTPIITIDIDPNGAPEDVAGPAKTETGDAAMTVKKTTENAAGDGAPLDGASLKVSPVDSASVEDSSSGDVLVGYGVAKTSALPRRRRQLREENSADSNATTFADILATTEATPSPVVLAKPPVRKLARELGVDLEVIEATGPGGIVTREDVLAQVAEVQPQALATYPADDQPWLASGHVSPDGRETRVPVKSVRKRTAEAMVTSAFTAPHVTVFQTVDMTKTMRLVERLKKDREFTDVRVSPLLIVAKALILAVRRHPEINASWEDQAQEIVYKHYVNLGIAAATPRGLVVPNIKDANRLGLHDLALALADLTATARSGRTSPTAMADGTITITNVGVFGIDTGTPILNPGEAAILAFGAIREQPWVHKGKVRSRYVTQLALSFDHRLVDGALGSRVLADVGTVLAEPSQGLVWS